MRIPQIFVEGLNKRFKKNQMSDKQIDVIKLEPQIEVNWNNLKEYLIKQKLPSDLAKGLDLLDEALQIIVSLWRREEVAQQDILRVFGLNEIIEDKLQYLANEVVQVISDLRDQQKIKELFFSYERIVDLLLCNPNCSVQWILLLVKAISPYFIHLNTNRSNKFKSIVQINKKIQKVEKFDNRIVRWHYLITFLLQSCENTQDNVLTFQAPNIDLCPYANLFDLLSGKENKVFCVEQKTQSINLNELNGSPIEVATNILKSLLQSEDQCPFFDIVLTRYVLNGQEGTEVQLLSTIIYNYLISIQVTELNVIPQTYMYDIQNRLPDQKDFIIRSVQVLRSEKENMTTLDQEYYERLCLMIQVFALQPQQLIQDQQFSEKLTQFLLSILLDYLDQMHWILNDRQLLENKPEIFPELQQQESQILKKIKESEVLQKIYFQLLQEHNFKSYFKKYSKYKHYSNLMIMIVQKSIINQQLIIPQIALQHLIIFVAQLGEVVTNPQQNQLDPQLETYIITALTTLAKNACQQTKIQIINLVYEQINNLAHYFKIEYDQVTIANAQAEHMLPLPERYHRFLGKIWDEDVLNDCISVLVEIKNEQLCNTLLQLLVMVLGEGPRRVRILFENGNLKRLIEAIQVLLNDCDRGSSLMGSVLQFLVSINSNDQASQLVLLDMPTNQKDGIIWQVFQKCYMPSESQIQDVDTKDDLVRKVINLYASSQLAKKQVERVIEATFTNLAALVDLGQEKIEEIVSQPKRLTQFYSYSKSLQAVLQLFEKLHPEKRSYKTFQGFEELQLEEAYRQKESLFNSLLRNKNFVDALEKIIMSPILIGSKNKDQFVEHYVSILVRKNKLNPYQTLEKELRMIEENYMVIRGQKTIDMNQLIDYDALSVYMSGRYFFRKIIKHISPQTYRGFYIMSRFHLIHYLAKMCKQQGVPPANAKPQFSYLLQHLLSIYFLSSQHAAFHESVMTSMSAKSSIKKNSQYEDDTAIRRKISSEKLIPIQTSCLELITFLHTHIPPDLKDVFIDSLSETVLFFLKSIEQERNKIAILPISFQLLASVTILQDLMKSLHNLLQKFFQIEQGAPLQLYHYLNQHRDLLRNALGLTIQTTDEKIERVSCVQKEQHVISRYIPHYRDSIITQSERLVKEIFFRKIIQDRVFLDGTTIQNPKQLDMVTNEVLIGQAYLIKDLLYIACQFKLSGINSQERFDSKSRNVLLECLIEKYFLVKELHLPEYRRTSKNPVSQFGSIQDDAHILQVLMEQRQRKEQARKAPLFERPEIKSIIEMVVSMGFSEKVAKKAIKRIEIAEPTMIIDFILQGKVSDDEDEIEEEQNEEEQQYLGDKEAIEQYMKAKESQKQQQQQAVQEPDAIEEGKFKTLLEKYYPDAKPQLVQQERMLMIYDQFKLHLENLLGSLTEQSFSQLAILPLNNYSQQQLSVELLLRLTSRHHDEQIIQAAYEVLFQKHAVPKNIQELKTRFTQMTIAFGQLALVKRIYIATYKGFYNHSILNGQEKTDESQLPKITLEHVVDTGRTIIILLREVLIPYLNKEYEDLKIQVEQDPDQQKIWKLQESGNATLEQLGQLIEVLFNELSEALNLMTYYTFTCQQPQDILLERHWGMVRSYLDFAKDFLIIQGVLQEQIIQAQSLQFKYVQDQNYIKYKRIPLEKNFLRQVLQTINEYGLHNQSKLYDYLISGNFITALFDLRGFQLYNDDQLCPYLENLLQLLAYNQETVTQIMSQSIKQVMLIDYCENMAQQILSKQRPQLNLPKYIVTPIQKVTQQLQPLSGTYPFYKLLTEPGSCFQLMHLQQSKGVMAPPPPPPPPSAETTKKFPNQSAVVPNFISSPDKVVHWNLMNEDFRPLLNNHFLSMILQVCQALVRSFLVQQSTLVEFIESGYVVPGVIPSRQTNYLFSWETLLHTLELLLPKVPQTLFFLRDLKISTLGLPQETTAKLKQDYTLIQFLVKFGIWTSPERLQGFLTQYISEASLIRHGYGAQIAEEILRYLIDPIDLSQHFQGYRRYINLQTLSILIQLLVNTEVCVLLCSRDSPLFFIPRLIKEALSTLTFKDTHPSLFRLLSTAYLRALEPFLQVQAYYEYLGENELGRISEALSKSTDPFEYHYLTYLRQIVIQTLLFPRIEQLSPGFQFVQFMSSQAQSTLKSEENGTVEAWPPMFSKRILGQQSRNQHNKSDEDLSESDSDQDLPSEPPSKFGLYESRNVFDNDNMMDSFRRQEEERQKLDGGNISQVLPQNTKFYLPLAPMRPLKEHKWNSQIPSVQILSGTMYALTMQPEPQYWQQRRDWSYSIMGLQMSTFEKVEKKKYICSKSYETHIRSTIDILQRVVGQMFSPFSAIQSNFFKYFINYSLPDFINNNQQPPMNTTLFYSRGVNIQQKLQPQYSTIAISNLQDTQCLQALQSIGLTISIHSILLNKIPADIQAFESANQKFFSHIDQYKLIHEKQIQQNSPVKDFYQSYGRKYSQDQRFNASLVREYDTMLLNTFIQLLQIPENNQKVSMFNQFPFETLKFMVRSQRFSLLMFESFSTLAISSPLSVQLKVLYVLANRIPPNCLKLVFRAYLETSVKWNQSNPIPEQLDFELDDEDYDDLAPQYAPNQMNSFIALISLLQNLLRSQRLQNNEDLQILQIDFTNENTLFNQQYLIQIIKTMMQPAIQPGSTVQLFERYEMLKSQPEMKSKEERVKAEQSQIKSVLLGNSYTLSSQSYYRQDDIDRKEERDRFFTRMSEHYQDSKPLMYPELVSKHYLQEQEESDFGFKDQNMRGIFNKFPLDHLHQMLRGDNEEGTLQSLSNALGFYQQQLQRPQDEYRRVKPPVELQLPPQMLMPYKQGNQVSNFEIEVIQQLCEILQCQQVRDSIVNDIIQTLVPFTLAGSKLKVDQAIKLLGQTVQEQAAQINLVLEKKRKDLRNPQLNQEEVLQDVNQSIPETTIIQNVFKMIREMIKASEKEKQQPSPLLDSGKKSSARAQIISDKKKHRAAKQQQIIQDLIILDEGIKIDQIESITRIDTKILFSNMIQTPQTYQLWLHTAETLVLVHKLKSMKAQEQIQRKLNPLLLCFLSIYQHVRDQPSKELISNDNNDTLIGDSYFERHLSGSGVGNSAQQESGTNNLQRTFSAVRENQIQMRIDQLFNYICYQGRNILNTLIYQKLLEIQFTNDRSWLKPNTNDNNDPLQFILQNMSKVVTFENKKTIFEFQMDIIRAERGKSRMREQKDLVISREKRLQESFENLSQLDPIKFRRAELKVKYRGEKGQDEGGIKREWFTNIIKDILESDRFKQTPSRFYKINPACKSEPDLAFYRFFGRLIGKALYDVQLIPAYLIPPIFKSLIGAKCTFQDLEFFNDSYYESYQKFIQPDCVVTYADLIECWIPEEYFFIFDECKDHFKDLIQEFVIEEETKEQKEQQQQEQEFDPDDQIQQLSPSKDISSLPKEMSEKEEILLKRKQKRQNRKKGTKQQIENVLKSSNLKNLMSNSQTKVSLPLKKILLKRLSNRIMVEEIQEQIISIQRGIQDIIPRELFTYLDWKDLQKLIMGVPKVDIYDLQQNTEYLNYNTESQVIIWFWEILKDMTDPEKADFLMFSTGSPLVPFGGFKNLKGQNGPKKFTIVKDFNTQHLIKAYTCFYRIDIPEYQSKEILKEKLFKSLRESGEEFDLS